MSQKIRLYVDIPLSAGIAIEPAPAQCHYLLTVMRQASGDQVALFNGEDGEWLARVEPTGRRRCRLEVAEQLRLQAAEHGPALMFAPLKRTRQEMLIEKATELGVAHLEPVLTQRSVVERLNRDRLRSIAIEAAEQSGRLTIPTISMPGSLDGYLGRRDGNGLLYVADEQRTGVPLAGALAERGAGDFLVGPEGGFTPEEREELAGRDDIVLVSLGPRVLRAETAAMVALALWQGVLGSPP
jgi:16S rRNA (uracil1498-N3)-methyltransferase